MYSLLKSPILRWLKVNLSVDDKFLNIEKQNTILKIIPIGKDTEKLSLKNISGVSLSTKNRISRLIIGLFLISPFIIPFFNIYSSSDTNIINKLFLLTPLYFIVFSPIFIPLIAFIISWRIMVLKIDTGSSPKYYTFPYMEKKNLISIEQELQSFISGDIDKTDLNLFFDRKK